MPALKPSDVAAAVTFAISVKEGVEVGVKLKFINCLPFKLHLFLGP